jgi:hypothetical protein
MVADNAIVNGDLKRAREALRDLQEDLAAPGAGRGRDDLKVRIGQP